MHYVRVAVMALAAEEINETHFAFDMQRTRKRIKPVDRVLLRSKHLRVDYRRMSLYGRYLDADGRSRRHWLKPTEWNAAAIDTTERSMIDWIKANHHESDDNGVFVHVHRLPCCANDESDESCDEDGQSEA